MERSKLGNDIFRIIVVIISATIYSLAVVWFLEPANLISIGVTGLSQVLTRLFDLIGVHIPIGVFTLLCNIPLCIFGIKHVSKRFVIFSLVSVLVQTFWMLDWEWVNVDFGIDPSDRFFLGVVAALVCGCGIGIALRYGTSTGGMDIVGQALALKRNVSIGTFSTIFNVVLAIIAGGITQGSWDITLYTIIFILLCNLVVDKIHTSYNHLRIDIITKYPEEVANALLDGIQRGCTILNVKGAYTKEEKFDIFMIISSYELQKVSNIIKATDADAFMTVSPVKRIFGKFFKHTII